METIIPLGPVRDDLITQSSSANGIIDVQISIRLNTLAT